MDSLREHVFNHMPIRLLTVGSEMKLLDRNEIFQHIAHKMSAIDERVFKNLVKSRKERLRDVPRDQIEQDIIKDLLEKFGGYAILSHTWLQNEPEVTFSEWPSIRHRDEAGYRKLVGFCEVAVKESGISLAWMDTICINKDSSSELDESIRSMYRWYRDASICITYLADTSSLDDMARDRWFTRGWTLQELLAPRRIQFYDKNWTRLGSGGNDKKNSRRICQIIEEATGIEHQELLHFKPGARRAVRGGIAHRMMWAANRITARGEDTAYSLMGIFGVSFPIAYGEGAERAFFRLIEAILTSFQDVSDLLNWAGHSVSSEIHASNLVPSSPRCYLKHANHLRRAVTLDEGVLSSVPTTLTNIGVQVRLLLFSTCSGFELPHQLPLCPQFYGEALVELDPGGSSDFYYFPRSEINVAPPRHFVLGVWDFVEEKHHVEISPSNLAFLLRLRDSAVYRMEDLEPNDIWYKCNTGSVIIFKLENTKQRYGSTFKVAKQDLAEHGMALLTLHI
ncbi:heterokaryon incompatibility protein-domain-containing protein [Flammula alnicola]|nr:heterokaryon incompatibility protein-domain-containing protein [Flammula alnicola]